MRGLLVQPDGRIVISGGLSTLQPNGAAVSTAPNKIARVNADGTLDTAFDPNPSGNQVSSILVRPDGAASAVARNFIARVLADGSLDTGFDSNSNGLVASVGLQADGKVLAGGYFYYFNFSLPTQASRQLFARINNDAATQTLTTPGGTQLLWERGGTAPEVSQVTFAQSTDGGTVWTALDAGTRVGTSPNWQLSGLSPPASGQVRARGRTHGGYFNSSSSLVDSATTLISPGAIATWRTTFFGAPTANIGNLEDFDHDGVVNILEFAWGTSPASTASGLPPLRYTGTFAGSGVITATGQPVTIMAGP